MTEGSGFREHQVMLCLNRTLYRAFIKLQGDKDLGRSYAGLLPYVEGLYHLGYISKEEYEFHRKKYSEPLNKKDNESISPEEQQKRELLELKDKAFKGMISQFDIHSRNTEWLLKCGQEAKKFKDQLESARTLLGLIQKATVQYKDASPVCPMHDRPHPLMGGKQVVQFMNTLERRVTPFCDSITVPYRERAITPYTKRSLAIETVGRRDNYPLAVYERKMAA
jgi:hypothetical protein